jgi:hypothetical protein
MRVGAIFKGGADRERALRYAGGGGPAPAEGSEDDGEGPDDALPLTGAARGAGGNGDAEASDDERGYLEEVNRQIAKDE